MSQQIFSDGIGSIAVIGGVVRIDFVTFSPTEKDAGGQPKAIFLQQMVMGTEAFLRATEKMQGAAMALAKIAAQPPRPAEPRPAAAAPAEPAPAIAVLQPAERPFP